MGRAEISMDFALFAPKGSESSEVLSKKESAVILRYSFISYAVAIWEIDK